MTLLSCFSPKKARVFTILRNTVREPFAKFGDKYRFVFKFAAIRIKPIFKDMKKSLRLSLLTMAAMLVSGSASADNLPSRSLIYDVPDGEANLLTSSLFCAIT